MIHLSNDSSDLFTGAYSYAQKQVRKLIEKYPNYYPMYTQNGVWRHDGPVWTQWCDGFLPGLMWNFAKNSSKPGGSILNGSKPVGSKPAAVKSASEPADTKFWTEQAIKYTTPLEVRKHDQDIHDLGFLFYATYYRWWRLTGDPELKDTLIEAGTTLALRFREQGQYMRSFVGENSLFIDSMMNVGLVFFAARETGDRRLREIALRHAYTTRRVLVRGDGSTAQEGIFDTETGEFLRQTTHQGYRGDSSWSRGLAWALYGFTTCYEYSRDPHFIATAEACADYYITHSPHDGIAPWDFTAPAENRMLPDTSAAAICAAGLLRLCRLTPDPLKGHLYWSTAVHILRSLCDKHLAKSDPEWEGILKGGVYHVNNGLGVDESVMWGEYFFVEALERVLW